MVTIDNKIVQYEMFVEHLKPNDIANIEWPSAPNLRRATDSICKVISIENRYISLMILFDINNQYIGDIVTLYENHFNNDYNLVFKLSKL